MLCVFWEHKCGEFTWLGLTFVIFTFVYVQESQQEPYLFEDLGLLASDLLHRNLAHPLPLFHAVIYDIFNLCSSFYYFIFYDNALVQDCVSAVFGDLQTRCASINVKVLRKILVFLDTNDSFGGNNFFLVFNSVHIIRIIMIYVVLTLKIYQFFK